jgi:hypothetical protein
MPVVGKTGPNRVVVDLETQALILKTLEDLPPKSWLGEHLTEDQMIYWSDLMMVNVKLCILFEDYFKGQDTRARNWDKKALKLLELQRDYYLSFYQMLQTGWEYISQGTKSWGAPALRSAGETVVKAMEIDCAAAFATCFNYSPFRKAESYNLYREEKKIQQLLGSKQKLSQSEENKIKRFITRLRNLRKPFEQAFFFEEFLIMVCADAALNDPEFRLIFENFRYQAELRHLALMRRLPETQGFAWDGKGNKLQSTKAGGVYK